MPVEVQEPTGQPDGAGVAQEKTQPAIFRDPDLDVTVDNVYNWGGSASLEGRHRWKIDNES
jgi:hypothetical protein